MADPSEQETSYFFGTLFEIELRKGTRTHDEQVGASRVPGTAHSGRTAGPTHIGHPDRGAGRLAAGVPYRVPGGSPPAPHRRPRREHRARGRHARALAADLGATRAHPGAAPAGD